MTARRVLIVDDDPDLRETLIDALSLEGLTVHAVENGREALDWLRAHGDAGWVVLLDLMMPVMDGRTFLVERARDPAIAAIPVVILTAGGDCRELKRLHDIAGCLHKTVGLQQLLKAVTSVG
ncbi:MAG TPA: response regulator [Polyangia bacterium]|nr:response regulator [Polyangia bacterium]